MTQNLYSLLLKEEFAAKDQPIFSTDIQVGENVLKFCFEIDIATHSVTDRIQHLLLKIQSFEGRGGSQMVSVLTFHSDDPSSNSAEAYSSLSKMCVC